jgi:hypothetical protein
MRCIVVLLIGMLVGILACTGAPITWGEITYPARSLQVPLVPAVAVLPSGVCPGSFRASWLIAGKVVYGTWWAIRSDSSAILMAARSVDGGVTWNPVVSADTLDISRRGCSRPAPSIFADTNGYVHFAYFLEAKEGPGVFFTHTMDGPHMGSRNGIFHSPVAIVYGEKPSITSITAVGDTVAVTYEDPNSDRPQVALALSKTAGHIFEDRVPVSSPDLSATDPRVMLSGHSVTVLWHERLGTRNDGGRIAVRNGHWD